MSSPPGPQAGPSWAILPSGAHPCPSQNRVGPSRTCCLGVHPAKGVVTNYGEGGATKREGGAWEVLPLRKGGAEKVLAILKGGAQKVLG